MAPIDATVRLTSLSHGAGCACKIDAVGLAGIREQLPLVHDPNLIVGLDPPDDAAVYRLSAELALVQTIDFFTPIVDDPYDFGRVAAANALSDLYAMGATPRVALNVVAFPIYSLGSQILAEILRGGAEVVAEAGAALAGGHSIEDREPKYGLALTGTAHPAQITTKAGGLAGDLLFLTKPIGGGLITTAAKRGLAPADVLAEATAVMCELNARAALAAREAGAHAITDVSGFGLLGHLHELCLASGVGAELEAEAVPAIPGALELAAEEQCRAAGSRRNAEQAEAFTEWERGVGSSRRILLSDAITSGGLLVAVPEEGANRAPGDLIGRLSGDPAGTIRVR